MSEKIVDEFREFLKKQETIDESIKMDAEFVNKTYGELEPIIVNLTSKLVSDKYEYFKKTLMSKSYSKICDQIELPIISAAFKKYYNISLSDFRKNSSYNTKEYDTDAVADVIEQQFYDIMYDTFLKTMGKKTK
jgi:hypothetical protein